MMSDVLIRWRDVMCGTCGKKMKEACNDENVRVNKMEDVMMRMWDDEGRCNDENVLIRWRVMMSVRVGRR